ncbi:BTAD domain-containing putative transcriptional regulator [Acrocarpospora sp. B8E8]|uniref:AfsR/SARP family transcriptional regulator n=1 Tax=Acrocarpospora sp. B8E8 TaxID=3153572 RepID=UPI00325F203F
MAVEFRLLGPVEVSAAGVAVPLGGAKPQTLLAALLLEHGHIVPTARLIDIIWPDDPPETAKAAIQTYVKTLRQALARHGVADVIVTRAPGYLVQIPARSLDVDLFDQLLDQAREASTPQETSDLLGAALALWRGPALAGSHTSLLAGEVVRLEQLRLTATQERMAADLALGRHGQLVAELAALVGRHPADERLRGQYMTALYRLGRQSDALASFREGRQVLVEELGVDPGPELTGLYHAILRGDPVLLASRSGEAVPVAVPTQLPLVPADFTGRALQTSALVAALTDPAPAIQVIAGRGGSGKSALAAHVAHQVATAFPDGQLYAELRGLSETPAEAGEVLGLFLRALGVEPAAVPAATAERAELYRRLLAGRRVLVLLDDAADERQVRPLLLGGGGCAVLVTSRNRLGGLAGVRRTDLDVLEPDEAVELLVRIVGADRVGAEEPVAREIAELCGRLPLAIRIAGAWLATRQRWPLRLLADRLTDERRRLDELAIADLEVRAGFELSYRALDTGAREALRRLGHLGVPEFASWVVAWLTGTPETVAEDLVERLVDAQLVDFSRVDDLGSPRFRVHDLVRIYRRERAEAEEPAQELAVAVGRVLGGWLTLADQVAADAPSDEIGRPRPALAASPVSGELAARVLAAPHDWFDIEQPALVVGLERAAALGLHDLVCQFTASARLGPSFLGVNRFESRERINQAALAAARRAGDRYGEAVTLRTMSLFHRATGQYAPAIETAEAARAIFDRLGDKLMEAYSVRAWAKAQLRLGRTEQALAPLERVLSTCQAMGDRWGLGVTLRTLGELHLADGHLRDAAACLTAAMEVWQDMDAPLWRARTERDLALLHEARGESGMAAKIIDRAVKVFRDHGAREYGELTGGAAAF